MMLRLFVFSLLAVLVTANVESASSNGSCGSGLNMTRLGGKSYYIELDSDKSLNWTSAQQFCQSHGLQLVSIETEEENNLIADYISGYSPSYWAFWLGASDSQREGIWRWTNGQGLNFTDWRKGQPDNWRENEDYLVLIVWGVGLHGWDDFPALYDWRFVCELEEVCS